MALTERAEHLLDLTFKLDEKEERETLNDEIDAIAERYATKKMLLRPKFPLTLSEIGNALDVYGSTKGRTNPALSLWKKGRRKPTLKHRRKVRLAAQGLIQLREDGEPAKGYHTARTFTADATTEFAFNVFKRSCELRERKAAIEAFQILGNLRGYEIFHQVRKLEVDHEYHDLFAPNAKGKHTWLEARRAADLHHIGIVYQTNHNTWMVRVGTERHMSATWSDSLLYFNDAIQRYLAELAEKENPSDP